MRGWWYEVTYPNGIRRIYAFTEAEARRKAVERWGTEPTSIRGEWYDGALDAGRSNSRTA